MQVRIRFNTAHFLALLVLCIGTASTVVHAQSLIRQTEEPIAEDRDAEVVDFRHLRLQRPASETKGAGNTGVSEFAEIKPFGANLFSGGYQGEREDGINPEYIIQPGDRITLKLWGAASFSGIVVVDARGNIFVPDIGPVRVRGVKNSGLTERIESAIRTVFTSNVNVYTNLEGTNPVLVYVTGFVKLPGAFAGVASDSLLYFLSRAGGIDLARGSFRDIRLLRQGREIAAADLYQFLLNGVLARPQLMDGDTIVVGQRRRSVEVSGLVRNAFLFELGENQVKGVSIQNLARPEAAVSHVTIGGIRDGEPYGAYVPYEEFGNVAVRDGDKFVFEADHHESTVSVKVEGSHLGPSQLVVPKGTMLLELLDQIEVDHSLAAYESIRLRRESVRQRQKQALDDSLRRLETAVLGASSATDAEARIRIQEAELIASFVARAREVKPQGVLVVANSGKIADITLEAGDIISIPQKSNVILVNGEVMVPQALVHVPGEQFESYLEKVGGYTDRADEDRLLVIRQNGEVLQGSKVEIVAGDEMIVLPKVPVKNLQLASSVAQILFQIALATATVAGL